MSKILKRSENSNNYRMVGKLLGGTRGDKSKYYRKVKDMNLQIPIKKWVQRGSTTLYWKKLYGQQIMKKHIKEHEEMMKEYNRQKQLEAMNKFMEEALIKQEKDKRKDEENAKIVEKLEKSITKAKSEKQILNALEDFVNNKELYEKEDIEHEKNIDIFINKLNNAEVDYEDTFITNIPIDFIKIVNKLLKTRKFLMVIEQEDGNKTYYTLSTLSREHLINNLTDLIYGRNDGHIDFSDAAAYYAINNLKSIKVKVLPEVKQVQGAKFKYICNLPIDLSRYQIPSKEEDIYKFEYQENCFVHSLRVLGVNKTICDDIQIFIKKDELPQKNIKEIADKYKLYISIKSVTSGKHIRYYGDKNLKVLNIGLIDEHYFPIEKTGITKEELINHCDGSVYTDKSKLITSYNLIKYIINNKDKYLEPITKTKKDMNNIYDNIVENSNLKFVKGNIRDNKEDTKCKKECEKNGKVEKIEYFDFETTTNGIHKPYLLRSSVADIDYTGANMGENMLNQIVLKYINAKDCVFIAKNSDKMLYVKLIAHNLTYDLSFIMKYLTNVNLIKRSNHVLSGKAIYKYDEHTYMHISLQDSYALIPHKLALFGSLFGLSVEKEYMPYDYYTEENIKKRYINIEEFKKYDNYEKFKENCIKWNCIKDNIVDILRYSSVYCSMDIKVLKAGYEAYCNNIKKAFDIDVNDYISVASLSDAIVHKKGCYIGVKNLNGIPREFIQKCVVGGRVMTNNNIKYHIKEHIQDFDAVSLYPSAMSRLGGYLNGIPKVLQKGQLNKKFLDTCDGYFIEIIINKVNKKYNFPLSSYIDEDNHVRNFTNDMKDKHIFLGKIGLEDLINFQEIEYTIVRGYYYNEGRNNKLREVINNIFEERVKAKKVKNPIETTLKLIMNSSYGKNLLKPIETDTIYLPNKEVPNYLSKHYEHIQSVNPLADGYKSEIKIYKVTDEHFNNVHCGIEILEMSKRIMNEVMCLAEDLGIKLYYQDTDSMHIEENKIKMLADAFKNKYHRELIGSAMGQFHSDFNSDILVSNIKAIESIFLGKKAYIDKLEGIDKNGNTSIDYHIRMKGVSKDAILYYAKQNNISVMHIYKRLYKGKSITFDLTCGGCKKNFKLNKKFEYETLEIFSRCISFN